MGEAIIFHGGGYVNNTSSSSSENGALIRVHTIKGSEITIKNMTDNRQTTKTAVSDVVEFYVGYGTFDIFENEVLIDTIYVDTFMIYNINGKFKTYGIRIDMSNDNSDESVTYTDDAIGLTPLCCDSTGSCNFGSWEEIIRKFIGCRPCLYKNNGEIIYLDDCLYKDLDGNVLNQSTLMSGDMMVEFKRTWYKYSTDPDNDNILYFQLANYDRSEDGFVSTAFASLDSNENDHNGDRVIKDYMYYGTFLNGTIDGTPNTAYGSWYTSEIFQTQAHVHRSMCIHKGNNYYTEDIVRRSYIEGLILLVTKSKNVMDKVECKPSQDADSGARLECLFEGYDNRSLSTVRYPHRYFGISDFWGYNNMDNILVDGIMHTKDNILSIKQYTPYTDNGSASDGYTEIPTSIIDPNNNTNGCSIIKMLPAILSDNNYYSDIIIPYDKSLSANSGFGIGGALYTSDGGSRVYPSLITYGKYRAFDFVVTYHTHEYCCSRLIIC